MRMSAQAVGAPASEGVRVGRYLPLSLTVTAAVTALPLLIVAQLGPARSALAVAAHVLAAVALSVVLARLLAMIWTRSEWSSDLVFGDLLIWGWVRRALAERQLDATTRALNELAAADDQHGARLQRLSALLEARDPYTHGHSRRVARHAERIAREVGLSRDQVGKVRAAALVHDIGKINVPRSLLNKPDKLTDDEFALVKRHAADGAVMVAVLGDPELTAIVRHHHERMDGTGYPDGLAAGDIPVGARIIAVADTFDAITSSRAYRKPRTHKQALEILQAEAGAQLDAEAVGAFVSYYAARRSVGLVSVLAAAPQRLLSGLGGAQSGIASGVAPIAQTACGVGGVALLGACLSVASVPASKPTRADADRGLSQLAAASERSGASDGARGPANRPTGGSGPQERGRVVTPPNRQATPRDLERPVTDTPGGDQGGSSGGGGTGGGSSGGTSGVTVPPVPTTPELPALPTLPDVEDVVGPVTDGVQPQPSLPQLLVPQLQLPQVQVPQLGLP